MMYAVAAELPTSGRQAHDSSQSVKRVEPFAPTRHSPHPYAVLYSAGCLPPWGFGRNLYLINKVDLDRQLDMFIYQLPITAVCPEENSRLIHSRPLRRARSCCTDSYLTAHQLRTPAEKFSFCIWEKHQLLFSIDNLIEVNCWGKIDFCQRATCRRPCA